jgi:beta-glucosidase
MHELGGLLAAETRARKSVCLLGPTINVPRSPLCGRTFEQFSEDPTLSGQLAAAYINGLQAGGISPTVKHFVGNEQEHERNGVDSIIEPRAFREIYLRPFQIAEKLSRPWAYMTSYNKVCSAFDKRIHLTHQVNGIHCSEDKWLLDTLLKGEWGFGDDGFIMSDWWGTYSIDLSIKAGMSLEMPGGSGLYRQEASVIV